MPRVLLVFLWILTIGVSRAGANDSFFVDKVEPLLKARCYACHSHASGKMKGGLALDSVRGLREGGETGPAVVPRDPENSLLVKAVRYREPDLKMPPKGRLSEAEVAVLEQWVKQGALGGPAAEVSDAKRTDDWWSLRPLSRPAIPETTPVDEFCRTPVDAFILAELKKQGLPHSPEADRQTLIRRLTYDLTGLPPSHRDVEEFVANRDSRAYENLVERLLAAPSYGERMARLWLDVVHYGESNGFGMDRPRMNAWPYRDYVIQSFNEDKPFDRFAQEQIAADSLFPDQPAAMPALGFLAAGPFNQSALVEQVDGTLCKKIALNLDRDDMVSSVSASFLSVTLHCARCHDHKFDPITMLDYYRMQSVFAGVVRGEREYDDHKAVAQERKRWQGVQSRLRAGHTVSSLSETDRSEILASLEDTRRSILATESQWRPVKVAALADSGVSRTVSLPDHSVRFEGGNPDKDTYVLALKTSLESLAAIRLEVLTDETLPHRGPGRNPSNGNFHLSEFKVFAAPLNEPENIATLKIKSAFASFNQSDWEVSKAIDGRTETAWGINPKEGQSHVAVFVFEKQVAHKGGSLITLRLEQNHGRSHLIGRLRVSLADQVPPTESLVSPDVVASLKEDANPPGSPSRLMASPDALAGVAVARKLQALPELRKVLAVGSDIPARRNYKPPHDPYPIHVLRRGDVTKPLQEVRPGGLEAITALSADFRLSDPKNESSRRAALARWITDERNPLFWRSIANRLWLWHFDRGLADTPNDFGRMGSPPTHPALLDWLASELKENHGSIKAIHRLILLSGTYRQSSSANSFASSHDAENRYLWRMNRHRLDAEQIRDSMLAITGKLDGKMGGPPAMQFRYRDPNPEVSPQVDYNDFDPDSPSSFRRGIYRFIFRNVNDPMLEAFDASNPSLSTPKRDITVTPLQALSLLNNAFVLRQSEHLAERLNCDASKLTEKVDEAFRLLFARKPKPSESQLLIEYIERHGLAQACRILFNANEFLFIQ